MKRLLTPLLITLLAWLPVSGRTATLEVTAVNPLAVARPSQTLELSAEHLAPLGSVALNTIHVRDGTGKELVCQAVDTDYDPYHRPDIVVFQADFAPDQTRTFTVEAGEKQVYAKEDYRAYGRFVRERFDDFAWENDRIAFRTYGKGLATWEGEPLSSSTVDIWSKRTPRMVINDWYMTDDYHRDHGEGADLYSSGLTRGCGANGLWAADRLWVSRAFADSRVLANGPIRLVFELEYEPFEVNGISVAEVKRVTLDAGHQLNHFECFYKPYVRPGREKPLVCGIGLKKVKGEELAFDAERGWLAKWEPVKDGSAQGLAVVVDPESLVRQAEDDLNHLVLVNVPESLVASYRAGFCWDRAGHITSFAAWKDYVDDLARGLASPIEVTVGTGK